MAHDEPELEATAGDDPTWFERPENRTRLFHGVVVAFFAVSALSFAPYERHPYFPFEQLPAFQAAFGLVCAIGLVLGASWARRGLERSEDYYDDE